MVSVFFLKNRTIFKNEANQINQEGLAYGNETLESFVNKDTDGDSVLDWEENLWGTDPLKRDTNDDGTQDDVEISKMKAAEGIGLDGEANMGEGGEENLTETDKFSREFFSTVATLNQAGEMDQGTADLLGTSLAEQISNSPVEKVYSVSDIKILADGKQAVESYGNTFVHIFGKNPIEKDVTDILKNLVTENGDIDPSAIAELDPIIAQMDLIIKSLVQEISVPKSLAVLHLEVVNGLERLVENLNSMKLVETDEVVALGAVVQYDKNSELLGESVTNLINAVKSDLSN